MGVALAIVEGNEAYEELGRLTRDAYERMLRQHDDLHDGRGNCWLVAAAAHGVAMVLGIRSRMYGGRVRDLVTGAFKFGGDYHYWTVVDDDVMVESPGPDMILITRKGQAGVDYVALQGRAKGLRPMAEAVRGWLIRQRAVTIP